MFELFKRKNKVKFKSPVTGKAYEITDVSDEVFASKMVGDGIALEPYEGILYSPVDGEIVNVFPTKHAIGIKTMEGLEILIHIGIDTVEMKGEGFKSFVDENQSVKAGDKLMEFDIELIKERAKSAAIPMVITNMEMVDSIDFNYGDVSPGSTIMEVKIK